MIERDSFCCSSVLDFDEPNRSQYSGRFFEGGSSVVRHLPLVLEVPGSIPARGEKNYGVRTRFL